jgi:hypothetical protein
VIEIAVFVYYIKAWVHFKRGDYPACGKADELEVQNFKLLTERSLALILILANNEIDQHLSFCEERHFKLV